MKIIRITTGLGNQMFQYAFILNFKLKGEKIFLDTSPCEHTNKHNGFELQNIFNIEENILTKWEKFKINGPYFYFSTREITFIKLINKIIQKTLGNKYLMNTKKYISEKESEAEYNFSSEYLNLKGKKYISGYFNSWRYFKGIDDEVRKVFIFPEIKKEDKNNFEILEKIKNTESVSIHIRRGDYLKIDSFNICDLEYYKKSFLLLIEKLKERNIEKENINFFIFSDDIAWCMENLDFLKEYKVDFIDWNKKENSYKDMQLMSECKHNIIPNSTFSWWGGHI